MLGIPPLYPTHSHAPRPNASRQCCCYRLYSIQVGHDRHSYTARTYGRNAVKAARVCVCVCTGRGVERGVSRVVGAGVALALCLSLSLCPRPETFSPSVIAGRPTSATKRAEPLLGRSPRQDDDDARRMRAETYAQRGYRWGRNGEGGIDHLGLLETD